jgi:hypothetical protein
LNQTRRHLPYLRKTKTAGGGGRNVYFCSDACLDRFAAEHDLEEDAHFFNERCRDEPPTEPDEPTQGELLVEGEQLLELH